MAAFSVVFNTYLTGDTSLNSTINGGIFYENLPENFDLRKKWIVWTYNKGLPSFCNVGNIAYNNLYLAMKIICNDTTALESINDYMVNKLNGLEHEGIMDIQFQGDTHSMDLDKSIYMHTLNFNVKYL